MLPTGSRGGARAKYRQRHDLAAGLSPIRESRLARDALPEPLVRSPVIEVPYPLGQHPAQVVLLEDQHMVEALAAEAA